MRLTIIVILIVLTAWVQLIFPAQIAPWQLIPDVTLLIAFALALYYEPAEHVTWLALIAGLSLDLWQPSHFGMWSLACMLVVLVTRLVHTRLLPRANWLSILATAALALGAGELVIFLREQLFSGAGLGSFGIAAARIYLPRLLLDLLIVFPVSAVIRSFLRALRASGDTRIIVGNARR
jgi:rod shape-determining protein MreD